MSSERTIDPIMLRAYFASVVGPARAPFGQRTFHQFANGSTNFIELAQNSTRDHVVFVTVSRADVSGGATPAIFSQSANGASSNDYGVFFTANLIQRFTLFPGDTLSLQSGGAAAMQVVVGQLTF